MCKTCSCAADFLTDPNSVIIDENNGEVVPVEQNVQPKIIFYTIGCPMCIALKNMLDNKHIKYDTVSGTEKLIALKIASAPMLKVDNKMMTYKEALTWLASQK
jgi:glutaredoxin-related protein